MLSTHVQSCVELCYSPFYRNMSTSSHFLVVIWGTRNMEALEILLRMYCIDTETIAFMFNGGSSCGSIVHPIWTNHINYEKYIEHWFQAPWVYLCSTSLSIDITVAESKGAHSNRMFSMKYY